MTRTDRPVHVLVASGLLLGACLLAGPGLVGAASDDARGLAFFEQKIRPVLVEKCYSCHSATAEKLKGGLRLDTRAGIRRGGETGPSVVPGKPEESPLLQAIAHTDYFSKMPPKEKLPEPVIRDFRAWVQMGAPDPRDDAPGGRMPAAAPPPSAASSTDLWSLRPVSRPPVPSVAPAQLSRVRNPIDAFILAGLGRKGLTPSPEADRPTLIRRLSFDLIGLPPTPEEVAAFVADGAPDAYERLVDRLLASPHHGERWARHWMDLVHFAETHGHDQDRIRTHAWPYRDYLVASFNRDKPYARFVAEQVAADALFPDRPGLVVALGMIAAGPWDESSLRDIRDDSIDRQIGFYIDRDDMVTTVMSSFVSLTVQCARCHDHKFDPIDQADYYALQAVFAGVDRADRLYDADLSTARRRASLEAERATLRRRDPAYLRSLLDPAVQSRVSAWEAGLAGMRADWTTVVPAGLEAAGGSRLEAQPDGSVLASGVRPAKETYTLAIRSPRRRITAVRLEVLPDDRLPSRGPGRNDNGNLHLTEFGLAVPGGSPKDGEKAVPFHRAVADFNQDGWGVEGAIDDNPATAWGIYPEVGKPHEAVFELASDLVVEEGATLRIRMQQTNPVGHPIGRFRLSLTSAPRPIRVVPLPEAIVRILTVPASGRTTEQKLALSAHLRGRELDGELATLPPLQHVYAAASDFLPDAGHTPPPGPRPVHVLRRGDIHQPGKAALPGTLGCVSPLPSRFEGTATGPESARRAALARWLIDPRNPLTHRSIVNRTWQHHFGRGIVDTPSDFGRMGSRPSHPELLDWLTAWFLEHGGSLKELHRLLVTSATYRQASQHRDVAAEQDADNRLLWRMNRRRLDAESVHDAALLAAGALERTLGGPSVRQFGLSPGVHVTPVVDYTQYDWNSPGAGRRSIYRFLFRTLPDPFMDCLDEADASQLVPARNESVTPLQAMALLHNPFILNLSERMARDLEASGAGLASHVSTAFVRLLNRDPTPEEREEAIAYAGRHGLANLARMLINSNEFLFVE